MLQRVVSRICGSLKIARGIVEHVSHECQVMRSLENILFPQQRKTLEKLVGNLIQQKAFTELSGRKYKNFPNCKRSALHDLKMADMCKWINKHKHEIKIGRTAR